MMVSMDLGVWPVTPEMPRASTPASAMRVTAVWRRCMNLSAAISTRPDRCHSAGNQASPWLLHVEDGERANDVGKKGLGAACHNDLLEREGQVVIARDGLHCSLPDMVGRIEIGLAGGEVVKRLTVGTHAGDESRHADNSGGLEAVEYRRKLWHCFYAVGEKGIDRDLSASSCRWSLRWGCLRWL